MAGKCARITGSSGTMVNIGAVVRVQLLLLAVVSVLYAADSSPGSYTTVKPAGITDPPEPSISGNVTGPVLTTDWCASLAFSDTSENMFAHPLAFRCTGKGVGMGYPNQTVVNADYYVTPFHRDITISVQEIQPGKALMDYYSDWMTRAVWDNGRLTATMAHGSPFIYCSASGTVTISFLNKPVIRYADSTTLGVVIGNRNYALFAPAGSRWDTTSALFCLTPGEKTFFSIAALPDGADSTVVWFKKFAFNFITGTRVAWSYEPENATLTTEYTLSFSAKEGDATSTIIALYPHQWLCCDAKTTGHTYNSVRGTMKTIEAAAFTTTQTFPGILPNLPLAAKDGVNGFQRATLEGYISSEAAKGVDALVRSEGDTYWTGKDLGRTSQLALIADQTGDVAARDIFLGVIRKKLEDWFVYTADEKAEFFYYNKTWGSLIGVKPSYDSDKSLNDHHFHYGYFVYAAATVAQYDPDWARIWKPMVDMIIRDCNSPFRDDALFPFMRAFDIYAGHSWASGNALFSSGNNQESTSEAINFAAATALWGMATGDTVLRDLGVYLYTTETDALMNYWFDVNETVFPASFDHTMVGIVWGEKASYETWFSAQPECVHGINMLPVTAASLYLGRSPDYISTNFAEIEKNNGGPIDEWFDILWEYRALGSPADALQRLASHPEYTPEEGESRAHTYYWIHNLASLGNIDTVVTADIPSCAVFKHDTSRTYVVWNPSAHERTVSFSNNRSCTVPGKNLTMCTDSDMHMTASAEHSFRNTERFTVTQYGDRLTVTFPQGVRAIKKMEVYTCNGRLVHTYTPDNSKKSRIPLLYSSLGVANGFYLLKIESVNHRSLLQPIYICPE